MLFRHESTGLKLIPRRSLCRNVLWFVLVGYSCLWVLIVISIATELIAFKDGVLVLSKEDSYPFFVSPSLDTPAPYLRNNCRGGGDTTNTTTKRIYDATNEDEIRALFDRWNDALVKGDPEAVAELYYNDKHNEINWGTSKYDKETNKQQSPLLLLLPTMSNEPRTDLASVEDYFVAFLKRKPRGRIVSGQILIGSDGSWAHDAGIYEFILQRMPQEESWNNENHVGGAASSTNNNETDYNGEVASAPNNEDNTNRTTAIADASEDVGPDETSVVRARYSFLYIRDPWGEWKIAHHHSSLMPESD